MLLFKIKEAILFCICILIGIDVSIAQVTIDKSIILTNQEDSLRQVTGLREPNDSTDLVNADAHLHNMLNYGVAQGTDSLFLTIPGVTSYSEGQTFHFKTTSKNTTSVTLNINSLGPVTIRKAVTDSLIRNDIDSGQVVSVIFDGSFFQLISGHHKKCPSGMSEASRHYCIEKAERAATTFWLANVECMNAGYRLCSWAEWYYACQKGGLGLTSMTNNLEFVDSAANEQYNVKVVGNGGCMVNGNIDASIATNLYKFRCCYSLVE